MSDQEFDWKNAKPYWQVVGRYEYWAIDEFREGDPGNVTYGTVDTFRTKKQADKICNALNSAYWRGLKTGYVDGRQDGYEGAQKAVKAILKTTTEDVVNRQRAQKIMWDSSTEYGY